MSVIKKLLLFTLVFSFVSTSVMVGQNEEKNSKQTFETLYDSIKANYNNPERTKSFIEAYLSKAREENNREKEFNGLYYQALDLANNRQFDEAEKKYIYLLEFAKKHSLKEQTIATYDLGGEIQTAVPNFALALERYNKGLDLAEELKNENYREMELIKISNLLDNTGDIVGAIKIRRKTTDIFERKPIDSTLTQEWKSGTLAYAYYLLSNSYLKIEKVDSARYYNQQIREVVKTADSCYTMYLFYTNAEIALKDRKFDLARENYKRFFETCPIDMPIYKLRKAYKFGNVEMEVGNFPEATKIFEKGLSDYEVSPQEEGFMGDYYKLMANAYKETGDFKNAGYYFEKHLVTTEGESKMKDDVVKTSKQREAKKFKDELAQLEAKKNSRTKSLIYVLLGASVLILFLLFFLLKFYKNKKQNETKFEALLEKMKTSSKEDLNIIDTKDNILEEKNTSDVPEEIKQQILEGLKKLEKQEYYLKQECNSYNVAKKINTNTSYLSKVINSHYGKNFNTYINDLRINYTIVRLKNDVIFRSYSIQSIAEEVGYKSADSFTKYFKKDTGLNPSFYIKEIKNIA